MTEKINVLGVGMDCLTAKEAMVQAVSFLEDNSVDTIEMMSMDALMKGRDNADWKKVTEGLELVLPAEAEILRAANVADKVKLKETQNRTFLKLFMKYLQKNHKKVFFVGSTDDEIQRLEELVCRYSKGIQVTGHALLDTDETKEEKVVNDINGTETDCILSVLPSPYQEEFINRNRPLLNTNLWFGCSRAVFENYAGYRGIGQIRHFFVRKMFFWQAGRQDKEENVRRFRS